MLITTVQRANIEIQNKAKKLAEDLMCQYVERSTLTLSKIQQRFKDVNVLVVDEKDLKCIQSSSLIMFFHPNLAKLRVTSLLKGLSDRLLVTAGVEEGDVILDCTMGLATDAIVFSYAVGITGKVISVESEKIPYILAKEGLKTYSSGIMELDEAMRRVHVVHSDHLDYMRKLKDKSVDIVYFDPMFREPDKTVALTPLRSIANNMALRIEAVKEAKRIARKRIIMREHLKSGEFQRLGFKPILSKNTPKIVYGVINI